MASGGSVNHWNVTGSSSRAKRRALFLMCAFVAVQIVVRREVLGPGEREGRLLIAHRPQEPALNVRNVMQAVADRLIIPRPRVRANRTCMLGVCPYLMIV